MLKKFLVITIDVEPDCSSNWCYSNPLSFKGVSEGIKQRLHPLFQESNIVPTYLINNVVLEDTESVEVFKNLPDSFELGTHLHPEFIEPEKEIFNYAGQRSDANCCFYRPEIESAKLKKITNLFKEKFGYTPTSFRAGRFSAGINTANTLSELKYKVDTSITPHVNWNDKTRQKAVNFKDAFEQPYLIKANTILEEDTNGTLLEVPVSIFTKGSNFFREIKESFFGMKRPLSLTKPTWLRPVYSSNREFEELVHQYTSLYCEKGIVVFNMMFHNVEVMPGLSPYTKTEKDCSQYILQLKKFFTFCNSVGIESIKLSDLYGHYKR